MRTGLAIALAMSLLCAAHAHAANKPKQKTQEACTEQSMLARPSTWRTSFDPGTEQSSIIPPEELAATLKQTLAYGDLLQKAASGSPGFNGTWYRSFGGRLFDKGPAKYQIDGTLHPVHCEDGFVTEGGEEDNLDVWVHVNTTWSMSGPEGRFVIDGKRHYEFGSPIGDVRGFPAYQTDYHGDSNYVHWVVLVARPGKPPFLFATRRQILNQYLANNEKQRADAITKADKYMQIRPKAAQDADKQKDLALFLKGAKDDAQRQHWTERFEKDYRTDEQKRDELRAKMTKVFDKQDAHMKALLARDADKLDQVGMAVLETEGMVAWDTFDFKRTHQEVCGKDVCGEHHGRPYATPNLAYYNPSDPVSRPQFFAVAFGWSAGRSLHNPAAEKIRDEFFAKFDFEKLQAMLGQ